MSVNDWDYRWSLGQTKFHMPKVHPLLDEGHEVIGNECVDSACRQFFEEHNIPYTSTPLTGIEGVLYQATDGTPIKLYRCDCFDISRYALVMADLMKKDGLYLLDCFLVDNSVFGGPPFNCDQYDVKQAFGKLCKVEKIDTEDAFTKWQEAWGIDSFIEDVYLLEKK
ncbi:TPMT-like protein [Mya arenaria]|uniref:TPMT-like protein n=1 Tax=Mya arenaria TaxID=6604 RepID=A0ABY7FNA5_MYAAR|nr:TPMT-like protein [Mya arenaria]